MRRPVDEQQFVVAALKGLLRGSGSPWDWDAFTACSLRDAELDRIRRAAAEVGLPLDGDAVAILQDLLDQAELVAIDRPGREKLWSVEVGMAAGLVVGAALWWFNYRSGDSLFHDLHLLLIPSALGAFATILRNSRKRVGAFDPRIVEKNKQGRV